MSASNVEGPSSAAEPTQRYRLVDGRWCIELRLKSPRQLFDSRDPAPFRERELDENATDYLLESVTDIGPDKPLTLLVTIDEPDGVVTSAVLREAIHQHFRHLVETAHRRQAAHWKRTRHLLLIGVTVLCVLLLLAESTTALPEGSLRHILREGLVITGWVAMWKPLEALLYEWWPLVSERRQLRQLLAASVVVTIAEPKAS